MIFSETPLAGAAVIDIEPMEDPRGFFARSFCAEEFARHGLDDAFVQCNISFNHARGTIRGMHYQLAPHEESKLVRVTAGAIYDAIVDLRPTSATFGRHYAIELSAASRRMLYVPKGFAHGFQTLEDHTEVFYQMSTAYVPGVADGIRYDDPSLAIGWPLPARAISEKDLALPPFERGKFTQQGAGDS